MPSMYTEMVFPNADVRFIAINNGVDSANQAENDMTPFINMVFCADCGAKLYQVRHRGWTHEQEHMVCATYRKKGKEICSSHQIRNCVLEELLLDGVRSVTAFARDQ